MARKQTTVLVLVALAVGGWTLQEGAPEAEAEAWSRATGAARADTVVEARRGDVLRLETWSGSLTVRVHDEDEVRLSGGDDDSPAGLRRNGRNLEVVAPRWEAEGDLVVMMPEWLPLEVRGLEMDVDASGLSGGVDVRLLSGDIRLEEVSGAVGAETYDGEITVWDGEGEFVLTALDGDVQVRGILGRLIVESTDGELELMDVEGPEVRAETVDGDVTFRGSIQGDGELHLATHDGDVIAWLPEDTGAAVEVSTFDGSFESAFPVRTGGFRAGEPVRFQVGPGGVRVVLQSFDGDIRLYSW